MSPIAAAYDNIRLIRRKIMIAQQEADQYTASAQRGAALLRLEELTQNLVTATQDFADAGFEAEVVSLIAAASQAGRGAV